MKTEAQNEAFKEFDKAVSAAIKKDWILGHFRTLRQSGAINKAEYKEAWDNRFLEIVVEVGRLK